MKKILLFSDHREIFKTTSKITKGKYKLKWCTYDWLNDDKHFTPDVIIMYFMSTSYVSYTKPIFEVIKIPKILEKSSFFACVESKCVI